MSINTKLDRVVDRVKPWFMVHGSPFKTVLDNVLLDHGGLPCVLPFSVHLDLGHLPDTQGYLGLISEPCTPS